MTDDLEARAGRVRQIERRAGLERRHTIEHPVGFDAHAAATDVPNLRAAEVLTDDAHVLQFGDFSCDVEPGARVVRDVDFSFEVLGVLGLKVNRRRGQREAVGAAIRDVDREALERSDVREIDVRRT